MENFKQEIAAAEKQISEKFADIRVLKQYKKLIAIAMRLKQKVESNQKPESSLQDDGSPESGV